MTGMGGHRRLMQTGQLSDLQRILRGLARVSLQPSDGEAPPQNSFLEAVDRIAMLDTIADIVPRSTRMTFVDKLAWVLSGALGDRDVPDGRLAATFSRAPRALDALCFDVRRRTFAPYMFWDIILVGNEATLAPGGSREPVYRSLVEALLEQRFGTRPALQDSATHGLFHLSRVAGRRPNLRHPP